MISFLADFGDFADFIHARVARMLYYTELTESINTEIHRENFSQ
jgi:hypothetical protein